MANTKFNMITHGYRGKGGDQFIIKKYGDISIRPTNRVLLQ